MAVYAGLVDKNVSEKIASIIFISTIKYLNKSMGIEDKLPEVKLSDIKNLAHYAEKESNPVYPVPVLMGEDELQQFLYDVLEQKELNIMSKKGELLHV